MFQFSMIFNLSFRFDSDDIKSDEAETSNKKMVRDGRYF